MPWAEGLQGRHVRPGGGSSAHAVAAWGVFGYGCFIQCWVAAGTASALDECLGGVVHHGVEDLDGDAAQAGVGRRHRVDGGLARSVKHNGLHG